MLIGFQTFKKGYTDFMGIINSIIDDESNQIVVLARRVSPNIDEYFSNEMYKLEVNGKEELLTDSQFRTIALRLLIHELEELGITLTDKDELTQDDFHAKILIYLRSKFDKDNFFNLISSLDENIQYTIHCFAETDICDDVIGDICDYLNGNLPLDVGWEILSNYRDLFNCTPRFLDHILAILRKIEIKPSSDEYTSLQIAEYIKLKFQHILNVEKCIRFFISHANELFVSVNLPDLQNEIDSHDTYTKISNHLKDLALNTPNGKQLVILHKSQSDHHSEFIGYQTARFSKEKLEHELTAERMIKLVANAYDPNDVKMFIDKVEGFRTIFGISPDVVVLFDKMKQLVLTNLYPEVNK